MCAMSATGIPFRRSDLSFLRNRTKSAPLRRMRFPFLRLDGTAARGSFEGRARLGLEPDATSFWASAIIRCNFETSWAVIVKHTSIIGTSVPTGFYPAPQDIRQKIELLGQFSAPRLSAPCGRVASVYAVIEFLIRLMSRSIEPSVLANSTMALATSSIFWSVVLFGLSADLANDSADELLTPNPPRLAPTRNLTPPVQT